MLRSKLHRPWEPRISDGPLFNPFAHTTEPEISVDAHHEIEDLDAENTEQHTHSLEQAAASAPETSGETPAP